ncbi:hypothetical protein [Thermotalea metallivorans]|uniref:Uncharacterized protein n=1 Tax=Thermotalea metallivorans TaxID=520762 RepID=A0A140L6J1_9FIRM|nr:hypothetical protein [Thermotalea metallivorans]KXG76166.1 hypothetical protein AN619_11230 [Thermotalea metallivorans]
MLPEEVTIGRMGEYDDIYQTLEFHLYIENQLLNRMVLFLTRLWRLTAGRWLIAVTS